MCFYAHLFLAWLFFVSLAAKFSRTIKVELGVIVFGVLYHGRRRRTDVNRYFVGCGSGARLTLQDVER